MHSFWRITACLLVLAILSLAIHSWRARAYEENKKVVLLAGQAMDESENLPSLSGPLEITSETQEQAFQDNEYRKPIVQALTGN